MKLVSLKAPLAVALVVICLAVTGCSRSGDKASDDPTTSATTTPTTSATTALTTGPTTVPTPTPTATSGSASPTAPSTPTSTPLPSMPTSAKPTGPTSPAPVPSTGSGKLVVINYEAGGADAPLVTDAASAAKLKGAPDDFKNFIAAQTTQKMAGCDVTNQFRVARLAPVGWASGSVFADGCGGAAVLWVKSGGVWKQIWSGQAVPDCAILTRYKFPASVANTACVTSDGTTIQYRG